MDGTLLRRGGAVSARDRSAITELQRRGVAVSILTGRLYSGTREIARDLGVLGPIGCVDGSHLVQVDGDRDLARTPVPSRAALALHQWLLDERPATFLMAGDSVVHDAAGSGYLSFLSLWSPRVRVVDDVLQADLFTGSHAPLSIVVIAERAQVDLLRARIEAEAAEDLQTAAFDLSPVGLGGRWGMVTRAAGPSKATAVDWLTRHHGVSRDETVAVGDWWNDIPMLRAAGRSFAMGEVPAEVAAAATDQLDSRVWEGGGVAEAAERAGLL